MRRILLLFTAATMMAVVLAMSAGPALADVKFKFDKKDRFDKDRDHRFRNDGFFISGPSFGDQELDSGGIETETDISIEGNNNNQCVGALQFGQTGNFANQQGTSQFGDIDGRDFRFRDHRPWWDWNWDWNRDRDFFFGHGDNEFSGPETTFAPENETACEQEVQQAAAASAWDDWSTS